MNDYNIEDFIEKCKKINLIVSEKQLKQFICYYELLVEWNSFMNLTAITDFDEVLLKHFIDSLAVYQLKEMQEAVRDTDKKQISLIDVGTGAGFPGIPLKIMFPELKVTLLDSLQKRICFLDTVIEKLGLKDIKTIHGRAEDYAGSADYREKYDFCVSRAVAHLSTLSELCIPFVKQGGYFISYKSEKIKEELSESETAVLVLGGKVKQSFSYELPDSDVNRSLLLIEKVKKTPKRYPRKAGTPKKEPIQNS